MSDLVENESRFALMLESSANLWRFCKTLQKFYELT